LLLETRNGNTEQAIRYAKSGYARYKEPRFILRGMDAAVANGHWQKFEDLLKFARSKSHLFFDNEIYWLQEAVFANYQLRYTDARSHYKKALALTPKSLAARVGLLWVLLESGDQRELSRLLLRWQHDAANESAYWRVYALAYQKIGLLSKALLWYQREVKANPDDVDLLLSYSTAFDKIGQLDAALQFRQLALQNIRQLQDQGIN